ncbi:hypothetical protein AMELA_G00274820 [Ameiurus melas]|uniref:Fibroblast growth factor-binding protein 1 n=1 Tax=Ameiurus melas TaxID=219545 RepID=A0A7J5ZLH8_AMEME|nr:hypothetical protein AMELA_G00274820 [Ameiurus melas]
MRLCTNLAMFLLLSWLAPCDSAGREKGTERKTDVTQDGVTFKGKILGRENSCTWTASGEKLYTLEVTCLVVRNGKPSRGYTCEYTAEPALCPQSVTKPNAFWKDISRALNRHKQHVCTNAHKTIVGRMCKRAPEGAHFRLVRPMMEIPMTTHSASAGRPEDTPTTVCTQRTDNRELAREKCGDAWASFCDFLFSIVQSEDC